MRLISTFLLEVVKFMKTNPNAKLPLMHVHLYDFMLQTFGN
jgi:hypothetical protein